MCQNVFLNPNLVLSRKRKWEFNSKKRFL
jgi:hypothetical protein